MSPANILHPLPPDLTEEVFETLAQSASVKIERIVSNGQASPESGWYDQDDDEWVIVLQGAATILFDDGTEIALSKGDYLNIPAHERHRVTRTSTDPKTIWLAVHY
jgi:cupin 2 domain-containing protein